MQKFNNPELEEKLIKLLKDIEIPSSIDYVAQHFNLAWGTARAILLNLAVNGRIQTQKTTKSLIFWVEKETIKDVE